MKDNLHNIKEKVKSYMFQSAQVEKEKIKDDSMIFKEGYFDSMGLVMLITFIEDNFNLHIQDEDLVEENFECINAISKFIYMKTRND